MRLKDKVAIITGGSRGIGFATADKFLKEGAKVILTASTQASADKAVAQLKEKYPDVTVAGISPDLSSLDSVRAAFREATSQYGCVDILVNNAGITRDGLLMRMKDEDFDAVIATNLRSVFLCTRAVARTMMGKRTGRIINISSINALRGQAGQANYAAAKAGIIGMTRSNSREFASRGITVNAIAPGFIGTDMTAAMDDATKEKYAAQIPLGRIGKPEDVANAVAFLASDDACYITGQILGVDGGLNA